MLGSRPVVKTLDVRMSWLGGQGRIPQLPDHALLSAPRNAFISAFERSLERRGELSEICIQNLTIVRAPGAARCSGARPAA